MALCPSCGGVLGRDCFNPIDCAAISHSEEQYYRQKAEVAEMSVGMLQRKVEKLIDILKVHGIDLSALDEVEAEPPPQLVQQSNYVPSDDLPF